MAVHDGGIARADGVIMVQDSELRLELEHGVGGA